MKQNNGNIAEIVLDLSIAKTLDYKIPPEYIGIISRGCLVEVPIRNSLRKGYVLRTKPTSEYPKIRPIAKVITETPFIPEDLFELAIWISKYYCAPLSKVIKLILPAAVRKEVKPKQQLYVMRKKTREELRDFCEKFRGKKESQVAILDEMLKVKKGILLTELLEKTGASRSPIDTLVKKGLLEIDIVRIDRSPLIDEEYFLTKPKYLNPEQAEAFKKISEDLEQHRFAAHLLFGVTGSGKTEIYLHAIEKALKYQKGILFLVPEISLTSQTIDRLKSRFEGKIAVLHHRLSEGERYDEWHRIQRGEAQIVVGARSAVFSPIKDLGLIIIDEEHEQAYKQNEESPRYHARDVAIVRARNSSATVILGSATPSIESYYNAESGKFRLSLLNQRASSAILPKITIIDLKKEREKSKGSAYFSEALLDGIKKRAAIGEQTILFLNRRGYHTTLICQSCGKPCECPHCDSALTFHLGQNTLSCHLCGHTISPPPKTCPECHKEGMMKFKGAGTEQIERAIKAIFPEIRALRIDADTTRHKGSHEKLLRDFGTGKADVLIGTQMIAKGLHFPEVTLVGILNADAGMNIPDFRASEMVFQQITQVAGRAGRSISEGEVLIQTYMPENPTILSAASHNYEQFYREEIEIRRLFSFPPFQQLAKIIFIGKDPQTTETLAQSYRSLLILNLNKDFEIQPIIPAGHAKIKDRYYFQFLVKGPNMLHLSKAVNQIDGEKYKPFVKIIIDVNPSHTYF